MVIALILQILEVFDLANPNKTEYSNQDLETAKLVHLASQNRKYFH
jgi:hypothetical protein